MSEVSGVSADGSVVVGWGSIDSYRWTAETGVVGLGIGGNAFGVSADGNVVVGETGSQRAYRWTASEGMVDLGQGRAYSTSDDGSVVVGWNGNARGFRWTAETGSVITSHRHHVAHAVSADGNVIVGQAGLDDGFQAYRWSESGGMVGLGDLPGNGFLSGANAVSADGSVIVGWGFSASGHEAFRWTESGGMVGLGDLPGNGFFSEAYGVSADGSVVVGVSTGLGQNGAYVWDEVVGMRTVKNALESRGIDLAGWHLRSALAVSGDGLTIVGSGINPAGQTEAWIATATGSWGGVSGIIPEPSTLKLSVLAVPMIALFLALYHRQRWQQFGQWS